MFGRKMGPFRSACLSFNMVTEALNTLHVVSIGLTAVGEFCLVWEKKAKKDIPILILRDEISVLFVCVRVSVRASVSVNLMFCLCVCVRTFANVCVNKLGEDVASKQKPRAEEVQRPRQSCWMQTQPKGVTYSCSERGWTVEGRKAGRNQLRGTSSLCIMFLRCLKYIHKNERT